MFIYSDFRIFTFYLKYIRYHVTLKLNKKTMVYKTLHSKQKTEQCEGRESVELYEKNNPS